MREKGAGPRPVNDSLETLMVRTLLAVVSLTLLASGFAPAGAADRPNILFIMADDLGPHDLGCYGQELIATPHIDRLAGEGTRFTQCYGGASVCAPSRCVLMTGLHTGHSRIRGNSSRVGGVVGESGERGRVPLREEDLTVAEVLKAAGYATGITGKWGLGEWQTRGTPNRQGFDQWFGYLNQNVAHSYYPSALWLNEEKFDLPGNRDGRRQQYSHDLFTSFALHFIRAHRAGPFFLYVPYTIPHAAWEVPDPGPYADRDWPKGAREYAAMVTRMDDHVGQILALLDELGLRGNTIVFFCSDNGGAAPFGKVFHTNGALRGKKEQVFEGGLRVPMIARWPGKIPAGRVSEAVWSFADFLATAAEIAKAPSPSPTDGVSVLPTLLGKDQNLADRFLYWEQTSRGFDQGVRWRNWKAVRLGAKSPLQLFDLASDPSETTNVADAHADVIAKFETYLKSARTDSEEWPVAEK
jgi:arylsulfatase A-like enzyme